MSNRKIRSAEGKEVYATDSVEDLSANLCEALDNFRAGIIDVPAAMSIAALGRTIISAEMLGVLRDKMAGTPPMSKFLGGKGTRELPPQ